MVMLVQKSAKIFHFYGEAGSFEAIANKTAMLMHALILQKPHSQTSKHELFAKALSLHLICQNNFENNRLQFWREFQNYRPCTSIKQE